VPTSLYSITKHAAERMCLRLAELWSIDVACVRLGTVVGPWERDTGVRDNFGTHSQLAALARGGGAAVLPEREIQRDWVYVRDVAAGLIALAYADAPGRGPYNLSSGMLWEQPIETWCAALARAYPAFSYRTAAAGEEPNVWHTDRDREIMDVGAIEKAVGFRPRYQMPAAYEDFLAWLRRADVLDSRLARE